MRDVSEIFAKADWLGISHFHPAAADEQLADLKRRVEATRLPRQPREGGWLLGVDRAYAEELLRHWRVDFDWRKWELDLGRRLNLLVDAQAFEPGLNVHLVIEPTARPEAPVIVLMHGWPSSIVDFLPVLDRIAHPERFGGVASEGATAIIVSLPGFGYSEGLTRPITPKRAAEILDFVLFEKLGLRKVVLHGSDWGAVVSSWLAKRSPHHIGGLHLSMMGLRPHLKSGPPLTEAEKEWLTTTKIRLDADGGYRELQATRPQTLAYALADSPAGTLAWILDKYHAWTGAARNEPPAIAWDAVLAQATLFWLTNSLGTAGWIYWADRFEGATDALEVGERIEAPTCISSFEKGFFPAPPYEWARRVYNVSSIESHPEGGHFGGWLYPEVLAQSLVRFAKQVMPQGRNPHAQGG